MDISGRIIIIFILAALAIYLLDLNTPVHDFLSAVLTIPRMGNGRNASLYHLAKICIFLIALVGIVKVLSRN